MRFNFVHKSSRLETELSQISVELLAVVPKKEQIEIKITYTVYAEKITLKILIAVTLFFLTQYTANTVKFYEGIYKFISFGCEETFL